MAVNPLIVVLTGVHNVNNSVTGAQLLAAAEAHIGMRIRIPYMSEVQSIKVDADELLVKYLKFTRDVRSRETRVTGATTVLRSWTCVGSATSGAFEWVEDEAYECPQVEFVPYVIHESASLVTTIVEREERRAYEAACHRPGTAGQPMDNADRTAEGYTPDSMRKHWA